MIADSMALDKFFKNWLCSEVDVSTFFNSWIDLGFLLSTPPSVFVLRCVGGMALPYTGYTSYANLAVEDTAIS